MGLTFKENCPDLRNTKVVDIVSELQDYGVSVDCYDPWVVPQEAVTEYNIEPVREPSGGQYDAVILAVAHQEFVAMSVDEIRALCAQNHVIYDLKYILPLGLSDLRL